MKDESSEEVDASSSSFGSSFFESQLRTDESYESDKTSKVIQIKLSICDLLLQNISNRMTYWLQLKRQREIRSAFKVHIG